MASSQKSSTRAPIKRDAAGVSEKLRRHAGNIPVLPQTKQCPHCPAKFTRSTHLNRHLKTHSSERLHRCDVRPSPDGFHPLSLPPCTHFSHSFFFSHRHARPSSRGRTSSRGIRRLATECTYSSSLHVVGEKKRCAGADSDKPPPPLSPGVTAAAPAANRASPARRARSSATSPTPATSAPPGARRASSPATSARAARLTASLRPSSTRASTGWQGRPRRRRPPSTAYISQCRTAVILTHPRPTCTPPPVRPPSPLRPRPAGARTRT